MMRGTLFQEGKQGSAGQGPGGPWIPIIARGWIDSLQLMTAFFAPQAIEHSDRTNVCVVAR